MANPSLQIGNSNWAIKEDNLLGYSTAGTRFVPQPITMTRASAGTRVNSSGLVETVELLGSEEIVNGDFATADLSSFTVIYATQEIVSEELKTTLNTANGYGFTRVTFTGEIGKSYKILASAKQGISTGTRVLAQGGLTLTASDTYTGDWSFEGIAVATATTCQFRLQAYGSNGDYAFFDNVSVKEYTANNLARVDYDGTASSLLVEPERTNNLLQSNQFDTTWTLSASIDLTSGQSGVGGSTDAWLLKRNSTGSRFIAQALSLSSAQYSYSIYLKAESTNWVYIWSHDGTNTNSAYFDLQNGVVGDTSGVNLDGTKIESVGNGWYRCTLIYTQATTIVRVYPAYSNGQVSTGTDNGIYIQYSQLELGSYPTSYIPTDGGTVTRVQDQYSKTGISNLIGQTEGTWFVDVDFDTLSGLNMFLSIRPDSNSKIEMYRDGNLIYGDIVSSSSFTFIKTGVTVGRYKIALSYSSGSSAMYINGDLISSNSTSFAFTSTLNDLYVGSRGGTSFIEQAKYNDIKLYKTRLSNSELATLTTI